MLAEEGADVAVIGRDAGRGHAVEEEIRSTGGKAIFVRADVRRADDFAALLANHPQKGRARFIQAEEIAALIVYLASAEAAPITGACIPIDFGSTAGY